MFRLHRSDRLAVAVILLAAALGVLILWGGTGDAVRALGLTETAPPPAASPDPLSIHEPAVPLELGSTGSPTSAWSYVHGTPSSTEALWSRVGETGN